jgi:hypothetical protein
MPQVTIYLADQVAKQARKRAKKDKRSLSSWVSDLIKRETGEQWPSALIDVLESGSGDLVEPDDPPPEDIEPIA